MIWRLIGLALLLALLVAPLTGEAQQAGKVHRIGYLGGMVYHDAT